MTICEDLLVVQIAFWLLVYQPYRCYFIVQQISTSIIVGVQFILLHKKAFDTVNRDKLFHILIDRQENPLYFPSQRG
jgi:hypothetical protein